MYLHIGKDCVINENKIIGIFNIEAIKKNNEYTKSYEAIKNDLIDISDGTHKTLVLIADEHTKGYITNIASMTLRKRNL